MFYSPILDLYKKHERHIHDFFVQIIIYEITYLVDAYLIYNLNYNQPLASLFVLILCYWVFRWIIRAFGKQQLFGGFVNYGPWYGATLGIGSWIAYFFMIRLRAFH